MAYEQLVSVPSSATSGQIPKADGNGSFTWGDPVEGGGASSATVTIATTDWSSNSATVSVADVSPSSIVMCSPDSNSAQAVADCKVFCTGQGNGTLTFTATTTPNTSVTYDVVIMSSGGGNGKDVIFIDYDGKELYRYSVEEINLLSGLPENPTHPGLTAQGWNWTLEDIKGYLASYPGSTVVVGQMYTTTSGDTEIDIVLPEERKSPYFRIAVNGAATIDWGDNSTTNTVTGASLTTRQDIQHVYASGGNYTIKITVPTGSIASLYGTSVYTILHANSSTGENNRVYSNCVRSARIGDRMQIGSYAFAYCYSLKAITLPNSSATGVTSIGSSAFESCYSLVAFVNPKSSTSLGGYAFENCMGLRKIALTRTVFITNTCIFQYCYVLEMVTIPISYISTYVFSYCQSLKSVVIPSVNSVGNNAFGYCRAIKSVVIYGTPRIDTSAFTGCSALESVQSQNGVRVDNQGNIFNGCYALKSVVIADGYTTIQSGSFQSCRSLSSITIPSGITTINGLAFQDCYSLSTITIPSTVTSIATQVFYNCYGMKEFHFLPTTPPTLGGSSVFNNIPTDCIIYVPYSADHSVLTDYQTASNWATYADYMQEEPQS